MRLAPDTVSSPEEEVSLLRTAKAPRKSGVGAKKDSGSGSSAPTKCMVLVMPRRRRSASMLRWRVQTGLRQLQLN